MKLLTHNFLCCPACQHYPLLIQADEVETLESDANLDFIARVAPRLDAGALRMALSRVGVLDDFDAELHWESLADSDPEFLHNAINNLEVVQGALKCDKCEKVYPIRDSIPQMVLRDTDMAPHPEQKDSSDSASAASDHSSDMAED